MRNIGFPKEYHLHTLRHYFVTTLLHHGVDKQTVAELVGHGDTGFPGANLLPPAAGLSESSRLPCVIGGAL